MAVADARFSRARTPGPTGVAPATGNRALRLWLYGMAALIFAMVLVGGATRLTDSGLSITEWRPIVGTLPPLSDADWADVFARYQQIPQYQKLNKGMSLAAFKSIFWWEWGHRFLGRLIGIAFAVPLLVFWLRGHLPAGLGPKLAGLLALGGLQGAIGWYMVQSGLVDRVDVSQYRLALHLGLAVVIFGLILWLALGLGPKPARVHLGTTTARQHLIARALVVLVFAQIILGAFVAGLKAGRTYNTWPLMDGALVPGGLWQLTPWHLNLFENAATVQFNHRLLAYVVTAAAIWHAIRIARTAADERVRHTALLLAIAVVAQAALGIWTLLAWVPLSLGLAHQGGAILVFALAILHLFAIRRARSER